MNLQKELQSQHGAQREMQKGEHDALGLDRVLLRDGRDWEQAWKGSERVLENVVRKEEGRDAP